MEILIICLIRQMDDMTSSSCWVSCATEAVTGCPPSSQSLWRKRSYCVLPQRVLLYCDIVKSSHAHVPRGFLASKSKLCKASVLQWRTSCSSVVCWTFELLSQIILADDVLLTLCVKLIRLSFLLVLLLFEIFNCIKIQSFQPMVPGERHGLETVTRSSIMLESVPVVRWTDRSGETDQYGALRQERITINQHLAQKLISSTLCCSRCKHRVCMNLI